MLNTNYPSSSGESQSQAIHVMQRGFPFQQGFPNQKTNFQIQKDKKSLHEDNDDTKIKTEEEEEAERTNFSKEFLKFSRKLANLVTHHLQKRSDILMSLLTLPAQITEYFFLLGGLNRPNKLEIVSLQICCLEKLWNGFKETMSYSKNKKICIVKSEDWCRLYSLQEFKDAMKEILTEVDPSYLTIDPRLVSASELVLDLFSRVLFYFNLMFSFMMVVKDSSVKGEYLRKLKTIENFLVIMVSPDLYKNYNHRSGKFALECCGKCKVCRSKYVTPSFTLQLERGRAKSDLLKTFIAITFPDMNEISEEKVFHFFGVVANYI